MENPLIGDSDERRIFLAFSVSKQFRSLLPAQRQEKWNLFPFYNYLVSPGSSGIPGFEGIQNSSHHLTQVNSSYRGPAVNSSQDWTWWSGLEQEDHQVMLSCSSAIATAQLSHAFSTHFPSHKGTLGLDFLEEDKLFGQLLQQLSSSV